MNGKARGFTLLEITVALGLLASCGLALVALIAGSLTQTRTIQEGTAVILLERNLRTLLRDPAWPPGVGSADGAWQQTAYFDDSGALVARKTDAAVRAELSGLRSPTFSSPFLELVRIRFVREPAGRELGAMTLQRQIPGVRGS